MVSKSCEGLRRVIFFEADEDSLPNAASSAILSTPPVLKITETIGSPALSAFHKHQLAKNDLMKT